MSFFLRSARRCLSLIIAALCSSIAIADEHNLTLLEAERMALERDTALIGFDDRRAALMDEAVASSQLPDPQMRLAAQNFPTDSFDRDQEAMTQLIVGVRQAFPRGKSRHLGRQKMETMALAETALSRDRRREVVRSVRVAWTEKAYLKGALTALVAQQEWFDQLEQAAIASYASGARSQHELIRIAMERDLLEEESVRLRQASFDQDATLSRWIGVETGRLDVTGIPLLPAPPARSVSEAAISSHPLIEADLARVGASEIDVSLAEQAYRPGWALDLSYGFRDGRGVDGNSRPDFVSAMVLFDVPIFTRNRQDRRVSAASAEERQLRNLLTDKQRVLMGRLDAAWSRWERTGERIALFRTKVVPAAEANIEATHQAYRNDLVPFDDVVEAEKTLLQTRTRLLRIAADHATAQAELLYLAGDGT
ncbi:MAG: TolC family protein [Gammaproteobacteria bacterium]